MEVLEFDVETIVAKSVSETQYACLDASRYYYTNGEVFFSIGGLLLDMEGNVISKSILR